jgi:DNA repair exonuclease SbcCD nuclease subunit
MKKLCYSLPLFLLFLNCQDKVAYAEAKTEALAVVDLQAPSKDKAMHMDVLVPTPTDTKIIKNADLKFETEDVNDSYGVIQNAAKKYQATIQNDASGKDYGSVFRNLTIRIPNKNFDLFIAAITKGVQHFDTKEISQQDVTETYIDIESRMKSKKKLEERYLQLLNKANKVSEMLEIEKKLSEIREEIEAKEGQLKYMQNRVSLSTISIEMYTNNASESGATVSISSKIWNAMKEGLNSLSNFMLSLLSIWPFILIFVGGFLFIRKRFFKKKTAL